MIDVVTKIKEGIQKKGISISEAFRRLDRENAGLISFTAFSSEIDKITLLSQVAKEKLFARLDSMQIGLVSFD